MRWSHKQHFSIFSILWTKLVSVIFIKYKPGKWLVKVNFVPLILCPRLVILWMVKLDSWATFHLLRGESLEHHHFGVLIKTHVAVGEESALQFRKVFVFLVHDFCLVLIDPGLQIWTWTNFRDVIAIVWPYRGERERSRLEADILTLHLTMSTMFICWKTIFIIWWSYFSKR